MAKRELSDKLSENDAGWIQMAALNLAAREGAAPRAAVDAAIEIWRLTRIDAVNKRIEELKASEVAKGVP
jgi:hypothetical protein